MVGHQASQEYKAVGIAQVHDFLFQQIERFRPIERYELARITPAGLEDCILKSVRVIQYLQSSLPSSAQLSPVERVQGITLNLLSPTVDGAHHDAAPSGTLAAGAGIPVRLSWKHFFWRIDEGFNHNAAKCWRKTGC